METTGTIETLDAACEALRRAIRSQPKPAARVVERKGRYGFSAYTRRAGV